MDTRTATADLREMAIVGGQFGVTSDQLGGFVEEINKVSVALRRDFKGGAEETATTLAGLRNVLIDIKSDNNGQDISHLGNALVVLANKGVATAPVVSDLTNRIGGYGIQAGLTSGQILGLSATLQELNVSTERGGTAVVKILQKMTTHTKEFAKVAGAETAQPPTPPLRCQLLLQERRRRHPSQPARQWCPGRSLSSDRPPA